jgi:histidinol phosphatase-like enzyme
MLKKEEHYEEYLIRYVVPESSHVYTPDFVLPNFIIVEAKGLWTVEDRQKHLLLREQYPHLDIRFVFQNPKNKIRKHSKTTYAEWCDKHGIKWATRFIPIAWFDEAPKSHEGLVKKKKHGK